MHKTKYCLVISGLLMSVAAMAQFDGSRLYWPLPINSNVVSIRHLDGRLNASLPIPDRAQAELDSEANLSTLTYLRSQSLFGRTAHWQVSAMAGSLDTESPLPVGATKTHAQGLGDLILGASINLVGAPRLPVREALRHEVDFLAWAGLTLSAPTGLYDADEALNLGSNRWNARLSLPMIKAISSWVPGQRTTLEVSPSLSVFSDNDDYLGKTVKQDPIFAIETHLTRDITRKAFISLDYSWISGGSQTQTSNNTGAAMPETSDLDAHMFGISLGFQINHNINLLCRHMQTTGSASAPFELEGHMTEIQLVFGWHTVLERRNEFLDN